MLEELRREMEIDAMVKFTNGRAMFGIIIDYLQGETEVDNLKFVPNDWLKLYRDTEHPQFVITLKKGKVEAVDVSLK
jgi:hypothetical protein